MTKKPSRTSERIFPLSVFGAALSFYVVVTGCSSSEGPPANRDEPGSTDSGTTSPAIESGADAAGTFVEKQACEKYVEAYCSAYESCNGSSFDPWCRDFKSACPELLFSEGSTRTADNVAHCAQAVSTTSCDDLVAGFIPCVSPGRRPAGAGCEFSSQCASLHCRGASGACGTCDPIALPGGDCSKASCPTEAPVCDSRTMICAARPAPSVIGEPCASGSNPCRGTVAPACAKATLSSMSATCQPLPVVGKPCAILDGPDDSIERRACSADSYCAPKAGNLGGAPTCTPVARVGEPCPYNNTNTVCGAAAYCNASDPSKYGSTGACSPRGAQGSPCAVLIAGSYVIENFSCLPGLSCGGLSTPPTCFDPYSLPAATPPAPRTRGAACDPAATNACATPLRCVGGKCTLLDPAQCDLTPDH